MQAIAAEPEPEAIVPRPMKVEWVKGSSDSGAKRRSSWPKGCEGRGGNACLAAAISYRSETFRADAFREGRLLDRTQPRPDSETTLGKEGYRLEIIPRNIDIRPPRPPACSTAGRRAATPAPAISAKTEQEGVKWPVPAARSRTSRGFPGGACCWTKGGHFFGKAFVNITIDLLAIHKIEYSPLAPHRRPGLADRDQEVSQAHRNRRVARRQRCGDDSATAASTPRIEIRRSSPMRPSRHVTIVPEIEVPGHSCCADRLPAVYLAPAALSRSARLGRRKDVFDFAGNDATFAFLDDVLDEVLALFPSKFIHIGGDECPKDRWKKCPKCQWRIKAEGLENEHRQRQSYFIRRIEEHLASKGRRLIGWDEILEGGLPPKATVMKGWRGMGGAIAAARSGHDYVATPNTHCYIDSRPANQPEKAYSFEPVPAKLPADMAGCTASACRATCGASTRQRRLKFTAWSGRGVRPGRSRLDTQGTRDLRIFMSAWSRKPRLNQFGVKVDLSARPAARPSRSKRRNRSRSQRKLHCNTI